MSDPHQPSPGQPYGAPPQYPTSAGGPPHPLTPPYPTSPVYAGLTEPGNPLGRIALLIAAITAGIGSLSGLIYPFLITRGGYGIVSVLSGVVALVVLIAGAVALVLGIIALRRPEPRLAAAIAVGIAGATVVAHLSGWAVNLAYTLL